ncbi:MAG: hypothetical protein ACI9IQ_003154, partial [Cyclobacteriaceae bacterium]
GALLWRPKTASIEVICSEIFSKIFANQTHSKENRIQVN